MFDRIKTLLQRWHEIQEVNALTEYDLHDLGLSRDQLRAFVQMPHDVHERLTAMAALFGVPEDDLRRDHGHWIEMLTSCGHCTDRRACSELLARGRLDSTEEARFCPNRPDLRALSPAA
jgi:hypothetical protein